uniref:non-specific serine/threonine protein kinase n=1 Tax=Panagrolaimus superbus TaxID=310955 RepID=A0A914ZA70_9BILA
MLSNFFGKWLNGYKLNDDNKLTPPPSDPRQSQTLSFTTTKSSFHKNSSSSSISIDFNIPDEFESKYDTPPMSLKRCLTDYRQQTSRQGSLFSSLSCDSSIHSKTDERNEKMPFCDILLPPCTPPLNFFKSPPPMLPEIDEDFFPPPPPPHHFSLQPWPRSSSLPHVEKMDRLLNNFKDEEMFMRCVLPSQPLPNFYDSQTPSDNGLFIDEMLPLTISSSCNTRSRHMYPELPSPQAMPSIFSKSGMNQASLFQEEQELKSDYVIGGYAPLQFGTEICEKNYIVRKLGFGHFSTVWLCYDTVKKGYNAVKVSRSDPAYAQTCIDEIRFLQRIADFSSCRGSDRVVKLLDEFFYISPFGTHCCASQKPLGRSLYQLIVQYDQIGFSMPIIQKLAYHLLEGLKFLHNDCGGIIHTDLKPENITINCNPDDLHFLAKNALTDFVIAKKTVFAHAHFPPNITDVLESANSVIYFDSVKKLEKSRQEFIKEIWQNEFKDTEGEYEEFARICRENDINAMFGEVFENFDRKESNHSYESSSNDEKIDDLERFLLSSEVNFQIVDLGTAQHQDNITATQFQTLQYRSPECVLKHEITSAIDIWSLACVLFEAATGDYLFNPHGNRDDLDRNRASYDLFCCFISVLGSPPSDLKAVFPNNRIYAKLFDKNGKFINEPNFGSPSLSEHIKRHIDEKDVGMFIAFMERMLCYNPERRGSAEDLLKHKWFKNFGFEDDKEKIE